MKKFLWAVVILVVVGLGVWLVRTKTNFLFPMSNLSGEAQNLNDSGPVICTMNYAPVCAKVAIQCITTPCDPIEQTFGNKCQMDANSLAEFLHEGECAAK